jgi:hypothetical protein
MYGRAWLPWLGPCHRIAVSAPAARLGVESSGSTASQAGSPEFRRAAANSGAAGVKNDQLPKPPRSATVGSRLASVSVNSWGSQ